LTRGLKRSGVGGSACNTRTSGWRLVAVLTGVAETGGDRVGRGCMDAEEGNTADLASKLPTKKK